MRAITTQAIINDKINETTQACITTYISNILSQFDLFLKSPAAIGKTNWEYVFECDSQFLEALNTELKKQFDTSVFAHIYTMSLGGTGFLNNKLICQIHWGVD